jgi:hypothetical protein
MNHCTKLGLAVLSFLSCLCCGSTNNGGGKGSGRDGLQTEGSGGTTETTGSGGSTGNTTDSVVSVCPIDFVQELTGTNSDWGSDRMSFQIGLTLSACTAASDLKLVSAQLDGQVQTVDYEFMCGCTGQTAVCAGPTSPHCSTGNYYGVVFSSEALSTVQKLDLVFQVHGVNRNVALARSTENYPWFREWCDGRTKAQCVACTPVCGSWVCGDDGCGGSCGACPSGKQCSNGQCVAGGSSNTACSNCLAGCQGLAQCCTGTGCLCQSQCEAACVSPNKMCCSSLGDCMCMAAAQCPY